MIEFFVSAAVDPEDRSYFVCLDQEVQKIFPPVYIVTCEFDPLRDDGKVLATSLRSEGIVVRHNHYSGLPHCFWLFPTLPETKTFMHNLFQAVGWLGEVIQTRYS